MRILQSYGVNDGNNFIANKNVDLSKPSQSKTNLTMNVDTFNMSKNTSKSEGERDLNRLKHIVKEATDDKKGAVARIKAMRIAKKIARGERVCATEIKFIREVDESTYTKAKFACYKRKSLELNLKYKSKSESKERLVNDEIHALSDSDKEQAEYSAEGVREVKKQKSMKIKTKVYTNDFNIRV